MRLPKSALRPRRARGVRAREGNASEALAAVWSEHIEERALSGAWPDDLDLDAAPTLIRELASRGLWLEQELIAVDPRLRAALEATGEG